MHHTSLIFRFHTMAPSPVSMSSDEKRRKIVVVGAGLAGVTAAFAIARRAASHGGPGCDVTVVDAGPAVASGTSFRNAGRFCPSSLALGPPKQAPSVVGMLTPRWLGDLLHGPPSGLDLRMPFRHKMALTLSPGLALWASLKFGQSATEQRRAITAHRLLSAASCTAMADYVATALTPAAVSAVDRHDGTLYVYHGSEAFEQSRELLGLQRAVGLNRGEVLPSGAAVARFPCLSGWKGGSEGSDLSGVFYAGDDHSADARCFTEGVAAAAASLGVKFQFQERVVKIEYDATGTRAMGVVISGADDADRTAVRCVAADDVVLACGIHTPALCPLGSARVPIQPIRGFSIELHGCFNADGSALPTTAIADYSCGGVQHQLVPFADDKIRVVGFADLVGLDAPTPGARLGGVAQILTAHTQFLLPTLRWSSASELWAGLRPMTPDNLPYVGRDRYTENVWLCAGHGATGWTTCTGTAEVLAAQLVGGPGYTPDPELSTALDPNRFATSWMSRVAAVAGL